jgi:hypothetical protein
MVPPKGEEFYDGGDRRLHIQLSKASVASFEDHVDAG